MSKQILWVAFYDYSGPDGRDSDYQAFGTREEAVEHAKGYLSFAGNPESCVFVAPVEDRNDPNEDEFSRSAWDDIATVPESEWVWIHGDRAAYMADATDIVADLLSMADGQSDDLGRLLTAAANEITKLRGQLVAVSK